MFSVVCAFLKLTFAKHLNRIIQKRLCLRVEQSCSRSKWLPNPEVTPSVVRGCHLHTLTDFQHWGIFLRSCSHLYHRLMLATWVMTKEIYSQVFHSLFNINTLI